MYLHARHIMPLSRFPLLASEPLFSVLLASPSVFSVHLAWRFFA